MPPTRYPTDSQRRTLWSALTGLAIMVLGALAVGFLILAGNVLNYLQPVLVPLAMAGILAYLLNPVVEKLEEKGLSRLRAIIYVFALTTVLLALGISLVVPKLVQQTGELITKREQIGSALVHNLRTTPWLRPLLNQALEEHPKFKNPAPAPTAPPPGPVPFAESSFAKFTAEFPGWVPGIFGSENQPVPFGQTNLWIWLSDNGKGIGDTITEWLNASAGKIFGFIGYALGFLLVPVYLFFFLKETATIKRRWSDFVPLKESKFKTEVVETLDEMNGYLIAFFRGQVLVSLIDGLLTGLALWMIGLPYAIVIGLALAILGVMPFIGFLATLIPALLIAAAEWNDWQHPLLVLGIFFVVQQIDGLIIQPKILGDKVGLHPMTIIFSRYLWEPAGLKHPRRPGAPPPKKTAPA